VTSSETTLSRTASPEKTGLQQYSV